jgi:tetratricopeptide (TPR) repeat protein
VVRLAGLHRLDSELPNLQAMLTWLARDGRRPARLLQALADVWIWLMVRGHLRRSSVLWQQIDSLLTEEPPGVGDRLARAELLTAAWTNQFEFTRAIDVIDAVDPERYQAEQPSRTALLLMVRGIARVYNAHGPAHRDFAAALAVAREAGDPLILGYVQAHYGALLCLDGDLDQARALHHEALILARAVGDENLRAEAHYDLAMDDMAAGDAGSAAPELAAAVRHYQNLDHLEGLTRCLGALAGLALQRGRPALAARLMGTAAGVRDRFGFKPWPYVAQAEQLTINQAAAALPDGGYAAQSAAGRPQSVADALAAAEPVLRDA